MNIYAKVTHLDIVVVLSTPINIITRRKIIPFISFTGACNIYGRNKYAGSGVSSDCGSLVHLRKRRQWQHQDIA